MGEDLDHEMSQRLGELSGAHGMAEQISYMIFGAAVTTTRAFEKVVVKVDPDTNRIFVAVTLRWFGKYKKLKPIRAGWLDRATKRCQEQTPTGFKLLVYYEGFKEDEGK